MTTATPALRRERRGGRRRTRGQRLWSIVTSTALGALVLLAMLTQGVPLALGAQPYSVLTGSMRPGIPPGSLVAVRAVPFDDIRIGDIVTYQLESGEPAVVTHRVVGRSEASDGERMLTTRGDANNVADAAPVREVQVRGIVVYAVPLLGYPGSILNGPTRSGIVVGAGGAVVLYGLFVLGRSTRRGRKRAAAVVLALVGVVTPWAVVTPAPASARRGRRSASRELRRAELGRRRVCDDRRRERPARAGGRGIRSVVGSQRQLR
ncbi:signal peptidase I [Microbacterium sp. SORGH_AS_0888]|uniref:signal peptidase I n=1 Tax=Microbacterium sp. SORGH_AS_0888 TaxID=3041791 RepID=UPI002785367D|nr:signal peptidase I [Microbacterium sp. SORGH_AS_0888]MDQ1130095.1 signal peptidase I [Microbacterium sp. SORGH_AS_0888]